MTKGLSAALILIFFTILSGFIILENPDKWGDDTPLYEVLIALGKPEPAHFIQEIDALQAAIGETLVNEGRAKLKNIKLYTPTNPFFKCVDCHNTVREDPLLSEDNPDTRLDYVIENGIPLLPGTSFWGLVNREKYFNGAYRAYYLPENPKVGTDLRTAIQFCASEFSKGRVLEEFEVEAILHYFWTLQIDLGDLELTERDWRKINLLAGSELDREELIELFEEKYSTFTVSYKGEVPLPVGEHYKINEVPSVTRGEEVYVNSCVYCHSKEGCAPLILKNNNCSKRKLRRHLSKNTDRNLYNIVRNGHDIELEGDRFMPFYTKQRLSNQQVEDLRVFIETK